MTLDLLTLRKAAERCPAGLARLKAFLGLSPDTTCLELSLDLSPWISSRQPLR